MQNALHFDQIYLQSYELISISLPYLIPPYTDTIAREKLKREKGQRVCD